MSDNIEKNIFDTDNIKYKIFDPTKNITILVESNVDVNDQPSVAKILMNKHPNAEQVGFVSFDENKNIKLRMAGGEFCGNATMCAGVFAVMNDESYNNKITNFTKTIYVDALKKYVEVEVKCIDENKFIGTVNMPRAKEIKNIKFPDFEMYEVVHLQGISHIIIGINDYNYEKIYKKIISNDLSIKTSNLNLSTENINPKDNISNLNTINNIDDNSFDFLKIYFENLIKYYCYYLNIESLGIIFYDKNKNSITPLVYVKNADTLYWENSCASGSIAVYEYLKIKNAELSILQPCKEYLKIYEKNNKLYLSGEVRILK